MAVVVEVEPTVTITEIVFAPTERDIGSDSLPDNTASPLTVITAEPD
jgi:hypothetical protein